MYKTLSFSALAFAAMFTQSAIATNPHTRVVSANFYDIGGTDGPMTSTAIAGAPPSQYTVPTDIRVSNWNNLPLHVSDVPGSNLNLWDSHGNTTTVDVDWQGYEVDTGNWAAPQSNGDSKMMNGVLQSDTTPGNKRVEIFIRDLAHSFEIGVGYDVIIYADRDTHFEDQVFLADDGFNIVAPVPMTNVSNSQGRAFDGVTDYDEGTFDNAGNWLRFPGMTGASLTITAESLGNWPAFISGFQIVGYHALDVPPVPGGDLDGDGAITGLDYLEWQQGFSRGDYTFDEVAIWQTHYSGHASPLGAVSVPEPGTMCLAVGAAIFGMIGLLRKPLNK